MHKRGRTVGSFIKDLRYDKWFALGYKWLNETFVLCKIDGRFEFKSLETKQARDNIIFKIDSKSEAFKYSQQLPEINVGGFVRDIEIIPNYMIGEMI